MKVLEQCGIASTKGNKINGVHEVTLAKDKCRLDIRKYSLSHRILNEWDQLSSHCVNGSSVNMFIKKVDIYFRMAIYT